MRYAKKSPDELRALRLALPDRVAREQPDVAEAARWIREAIGLNQEAFARLVGLSKPLVARLERGEANPTLDTLNAIGKPFGLRIAFVPRQRPAHDAALPTEPNVARPEAATPDTPRARPTRVLPPLSFEKAGPPDKSGHDA
ncbi:MAG: hypothetical protein GAK40_00208 [Burkholderia plantarii]|nr:MAG: hypothetical protein GAK40_00208 [Burkholderia plantarii]